MTNTTNTIATTTDTTTTNTKATEAVRQHARAAAEAAIAVLGDWDTESLMALSEVMAEEYQAAIAAAVEWQNNFVDYEALRGKW
jgi:hypothetical protein